MKKTTLLLLLTAIIYFGCNSSKKTSTSTSTSTSTTTTTEVVEETADMVMHATKQKGELTTDGKITFAAANDRYSANGEFKSWHFTSIEMETNAADIKSLTASLAIDLTSIWEKSEKLTNHLKAPDFFNIEKYTTAKLDIKNVKKQSDGTYKADMKLNMKGLTQDMSSTFKVTSMDPVHVTGTAMVNRNLFGLGSEGMSVPEMVEVTYDTDLPN